MNIPIENLNRNRNRRYILSCKYLLIYPILLEINNSMARGQLSKND